MWTTDSTTEVPSPSPPAELVKSRSARRHSSRWRLSPVAALLIGLLGLTAGVSITTLMTAPAVTPTFTRLTFARGIVRSARFADDGGTVVYSAAWDGEPMHVYLTRASAARATLLALPPGPLLSASSSEELAISEDYSFDGELGLGALTRAPLRGSGTRRVLESVRDADWTPDGRELAVIRRVQNRDQLEWPIGKVLYATNGHLSHLRVSPDGRRAAFAEHRTYGAEEADIVVIGSQGDRSALATDLHDIRGIAWSPGRDELWFSAGSDDPQSFATLQAIGASGRRRTVLRERVDLRLMDIDPTGRVLLSGETPIFHIEAMLPGDGSSRDFSIVDAPMAQAMSVQGKEVLITRYTAPNVMLRKADGETLTLADGQGLDLSSDGQRALLVTAKPAPRLVLFAIRSGDTKQLPNPANLKIVDAKFLPDGENVVFLGGLAGEPWGAYLQNVDSGVVTRFTKSGVTFLPSRTFAVSADGQDVALTDRDGRVRLFPVAGGEPKTISGLADGEYPVQWKADGTSVFVTRNTSPPWRIEQLNLNSGERTPWREFSPVSNAGIASSRVRMSPDGEALVHSYSQVLSNLYIVDGLN
jgi:Tol biopolymer transport system component